MLELRFGSYSIEATFAGTPTLSRRKSTWRYCFLWPPPRCHTTISPWLLRPPERFFASSKDFSGVSLVMWILSRTVINRRDAVYGLKLFSPIASLPLTFLRRCCCPCGATSTAFSHSLYCNCFGPAVKLVAAFFRHRLTGSPRTRSSFRLRRASRRLSSSPCDSPRFVPDAAFCRQNSRCERR